MIGEYKYKGNGWEQSFPGREGMSIERRPKQKAENSINILGEDELIMGNKFIGNWHIYLCKYRSISSWNSSINHSLFGGYETKQIWHTSFWQFCFHV